MFYHNLIFSDNASYLTSQVYDTKNSLDEQVLAEALEVPTHRTRSLEEDECGSKKFLRHIG